MSSRPAHVLAEVRSLPRRLGLFDATTIVAGSMIGSGIFIVSADAARNFPSALGLLLVWVLAGAVTVMGAWSYGRLAAAMPRAGGQYVYLREAWGDMGGFLYGWAILLVIQTGTIAAVGVAFAKYLGVLFPAVSSEPWVSWAFLKLSPASLVGILLIGLLTWWNTTSVRNGAVVQNVFTSAKVLSLVGLLLACVMLGSRIGSGAVSWRMPAAADLLHPLLWAFAAAAVQPLFAADAWNNVTFLSEEVRQPEGNVPRALLLGTALVCALYFLTNVGYVNVLSVDAIAHAKEDRVATAAISGILSGNLAPELMAIVILVSTFGCLNGLILSRARVLYAMSRDGLFLAPLAKVDKATEIPVPALVLQFVWSAALALSGRYGDLLDFVMIAVLAFYAATIIGRFRLARRMPELAPRGIADVVVPAVYVLLVLYVCAGEVLIKPIYPLWSLVIVATGVPAFFLFRRRRT